MGITINAMSAVHTFPTITTLYSDTKIPLQSLGGGAGNAARQFELSVLLDWLLVQMGIGTVAQTISTTATIAVSGGNLLQVIAVKAQSGSRTIKIGTTAGGDDVLELSTIPTNTDFSLTLNRYTSTTLTLHFTLTGGTADVLMFTKPEA